MPDDLKQATDELSSRVAVLEGSLNDRIDSRLAKTEIQLRNSTADVRVEVGHVKGQIAMLVGGGVLGFLVSVGWLVWLQGKTSSVGQTVDDMIRRAGDQITAKADEQARQLSQQYAKSLEGLNAGIEKASKERAQRPQAPVPVVASETATAKRQAFECLTELNQSALMRFPTATAQLTVAEVASGYRAVSGGCSITSAGQDGVVHNAPLIRSTPDIANNAWICAAADPPNLPTMSKVTAYVVGCRVAAPT